MNRPIKFRAWDREKKKMFEVNTLCLYDNASWAHGMDWIHNTQEWYGEAGFVSNPVLMQFTGMADKNNMMIFEGDIVRHTRLGIFEVVFESCSFNAIAGYKIPLSGMYEYDCEVIGSIYENPELLSNP